MASRPLTTGSLGTHSHPGDLAPLGLLLEDFQDKFEGFLCVPERFRFCAALADCAGHLKTLSHVVAVLALSENDSVFHRPAIESASIKCPRPPGQNTSQGTPPSREVVTDSRIGERSSHSWIVLKYLLGYPNVKNYDGSWTEWGNLVKTPIER